MTTAAPVLELRDVSKSFGPVVALRSGSLRVEAGSIHALVGENGAGKSTLVKVLAGIHGHDAGTIEGSASLAVIHQELALVPELSVAENLFLNRLPK